MNMENQTELFKTTDIKSSAYLLTEGLSIVKIIKSDPQKIVFCFSDTDQAKELLQQYWTNKALVNPRSLFENFDYLKDLIHRDYEV
jgi:hypothetical protein